MEKETRFDPLDMNNYRIEKLPKLQKTGFERWMAVIGGPLAAIAFVYIYWFANIPFLDTFDITALGKESAKRFDELGAEGFSRINYAMLAIFAASIILWITESIPNYLTSLVLILAVVLTGVTSEKTAYAQLGHPVMWLNILSFVLASMLVKTQVAKRFALWFVIKFGKNATMIIFSFMVINIVLSAFISATTAKATMEPGASESVPDQYWRVGIHYRFRGESTGRSTYCRSDGMECFQLSGLVCSGFPVMFVVDGYWLVRRYETYIPSQKRRRGPAD